MNTRREKNIGNPVPWILASWAENFVGINFGVYSRCLLSTLLGDRNVVMTTYVCVLLYQ